MGLDGGTIPSRTDLLRRASWKLACADSSRSTRGGQINNNNFRTEEKKLAPHELAKIRFSTCALSGEILQPPLMADDYGNLYNKESVIEFLLGQGPFMSAKHQYLESFGHLKSIKNVFEVHFIKTENSENPIFSNDGKMEKRGEFICPITGLETNGFHSFSTLRICGHCFSQKALSEIKERICMQCNKPFTEKDIVLLNPTSEQLKEIKEKLPKEKKKNFKKREKKRRKRRKGNHR